MTANTIPFAPSALHEILAWSANRPAWQRDALRRIVTQSELTTADVIELGDLCRAAHGAPTKQLGLTPIPLDASHIPPSPGAAQSVSLLSIANLCRVNRLPSDQVLSFSDGNGLTVVFGNNGSGKSGYARVIKRACRTRGNSPNIKANAFDPAQTATASADITFRIAGQKKVVSWLDGTAADPSLANVFVFDASTAGHYLQEDGPTVFTPHGLDILQRLSSACDAVNKQLKSAIADIDNECQSASKPWKPSAATKVASLLTNLSATTSKSEIDLLASFTSDDAKRLAELNDAIKSDPRLKAKEIRASATRIRNFATRVDATFEALSLSQLETHRKRIDDAASASEAAKAFASNQFDAGYLPNTGGTIWRALFEAARQFSVNEAYKDQPFPVVSDDAKCVLCQQPIGDEAVRKFEAFDAFCRNESQRLAEAATQNLKQSQDALRLLLPLLPDRTQIEADILSLMPEQMSTIDLFVKSADACLKTTQESATTNKWTDPCALTLSPAQILRDLSSALEAHATLVEGADDAEYRAKLIAEKDELLASEWLATVKEDIVSQVERLQRIVCLEKCRADTVTTGVTKKSSDLTKRIVTDAFRKRFEAEIAELGLVTISVKVEEIKGAKGETCFGLRLHKAESHKIHEIASEGEQRCIALATFLAELSQASHQSALVFDDPVSSLDHWNRNVIARRLVKESQTRQVVVLTHDTVFLHDLQTHADDSGTSCTFRYLDWAGQVPGMCNDGLPWDCKSPQDRLDKLEKKTREIARSWSLQPSEADKAEMQQAYSWLRGTIESIIEKVVFSGVVFRFRAYINVKQLREVVGFTQNECDELLRLYGVCCNVTEAHAPASGKQATIPNPTQLSTDVSNTRTILDAIRQRQKTKSSQSSAAPQAAAGS